MLTIEQRIKDGDNDFIIQRDMMIIAKLNGMLETAWVAKYAIVIRRLIEEYKLKYKKQ